MATNAPSAGAKVIPKLKPSDCLTREEFERRYEAMPECKKAELIEGIAYLPSPVRLTRHGELHAELMTWLGVYKAATPGIRSAGNASNRLDLENEPQPDCILFVDPRCGGSVQISADDYVVGPPELVAEVSTNSVSFDRGPKLRTFRRHGVKEYLIWRVQDRVFEWNLLHGGEYEPREADQNGVLCSEVFPGLWLDAYALIRGNLSKVLSTLQRGIASDAHRDFVRQFG